MKIFIDDEEVSIINCSSSAFLASQCLFSKRQLQTSSHIIQIQPMTNNSIEITLLTACIGKQDSKEIQVQSIQEATFSPRILTRKKQSGQQIEIDSEKDLAVTFSFYGNAFLLTGNCGPQYGLCKISIDGQIESSFDSKFNEEHSEPTLLFQQSTLKMGHHQVTIRSEESVSLLHLISFSSSQINSNQIGEKHQLEDQNRITRIQCTQFDHSGWTPKSGQRWEYRFLFCR